MTSILEEFASGNIDPFEGTIKKGSRYECILQTAYDCEEKLMSALDGELKETLRRFIETQSESSSIDGNNRFINGYRLGVLMTMEVFNGQL